MNFFKNIFKSTDNGSVISVDLLKEIADLSNRLKRIEQSSLKDDESVKTEQEIRRLELLKKFSNLQGKATEIELEWQRIQQEANDIDFYNQVFLGKADSEVAHKDGFVRGIKWVLEKYG